MSGEKLLTLSYTNLDDEHVDDDDAMMMITKRKYSRVRNVTR